MTRQTVINEEDGGAGDPLRMTTKLKEGEVKIERLLEQFPEDTVEEIKDVITAENLCSCQNPWKTSFQCNAKLKKVAQERDENAEILNNLAGKVQDFSVALMDQVTPTEEKSIVNNASLLDSITQPAIDYQQKKFISHRLVYRLFKIRWKRGLPSKYRQGMKARLTVISFTILETILTPILLPLIAYFSYRDQTCLERKMLRDLYLNYLRTPFVISIKDRLSQVVHLGLHFRLCVLASSVSVRTEEWLTLIFYIGFMLSEYQQYRSSKSAKEKRVRVYLRNMWNYVDMVILGLFFMMLVLRCFTLNETDPYQSRLLQVVNILYGISTLLLTLRFSSILEVNKTVGPLQLALFRMCIDLLIILTQFSFVIMAFSAAITKVYVAEISFLTPAHQRESNETGRLEELNETGRTGGFCTKGKSACLLQTSKCLIWSVFGLTELDTMETNDDGSDYVVGILFVSFLIISVVMLVNILIALLTNTYNKVETNADLEWKFFRAVVAEEYRRYHPIVVPFNIISLPMSFLYTKKYGDNRAKRVKERQRRHEERCRLELFPALTRRYLDKYGGSFPLSNEEKIDLVADKFDQLANKIDVVANKIKQQEHKLDRLLEVMEKIHQAQQTPVEFLHSQVSQHNDAVDHQLDKNIQRPSGEASADF